MNVNKGIITLQHVRDVVVCAKKYHAASVHMHRAMSSYGVVSLQTLFCIGTRSIGCRFRPPSMLYALCTTNMSLLHDAFSFSRV